MRPLIRTTDKMRKGKHRKQGELTEQQIRRMIEQFRQERLLTEKPILAPKKALQKRKLKKRKVTKKKVTHKKKISFTKRSRSKTRSSKKRK